ncbi:MAG: class I SAM-dependent methyltransferase [Proteobacteria bacterium]|nr:class I SAM-dependent methyltransferase [Pseudomonadota bacterium]
MRPTCATGRRPSPWCGKCCGSPGSGRPTWSTISAQATGASPSPRHASSARGVGIDIDPQRVREAEANALAARVTDRVRFRNEDLFEADFRNGAVVTLFLYPDVNRKLRPRLLRELVPGTRVVSYHYDMSDWAPLRTMPTPEANIYLWRIPGKKPPQ